MTSSISSSEALPDPEIAAKWRRWLVAFLSVPLLGGALILAFLIAVDPYDTGKFGLFDIDGIDDSNTRTAIPSRARDRQFDSAVIGNSTVQRLNPAELSRATGRRFVQLYMIGANPLETLAVLDLYLRSHPHPGALVIGADPSWCSHRESDPATGASILALRQEFLRICRSADFLADDRTCVPENCDRSGPAANASVVDGFLDYEEFWLPGRFRAASSPEGSPAGSHRCRPQCLSRDFAARCCDQAASVRCSRRSDCSADRASNRSAARDDWRDASRKPATRRWRGSWPAGRTAISSTIASTTR